MASNRKQKPEPPEMDSKRINTCSAEQSPHLPLEIFEEILSRLQVKLLPKLKCVSKSWRSLIESEPFIKTHLRYSTKDEAFPHHSVILNYGGLKQCSLHSLLNEPYTDSSPIDDPINIQLESPRIVGCCNGLLCILEQSGHFSLWNPSTRIFKKLPEMGRGIKRGLIMSPGFGWDESSDAYKVFAIMLESNKSVGRVYSSKTNSWKIVEHDDFSFSFSFHYREGQFASGKLHWHDRNGRGISYFDLKSEVFGIVEEPSYTEGSFSRWMGVLGQRLCMVCDYAPPDCCLDVWVQNDGAEESWEKVAVVPHPDEAPERPLSAPFGVGPNGEIIMLIYGSGFLVYYPNGNVFRPLQKINCFQEAYLYIESLVSAS